MAKDIKIPSNVLALCKDNEERGALVLLFVLADSKTGIYNTTYRELVTLWGKEWNVWSVRRFLKKLEPFIMVKSDNKRTEICVKKGVICNTLYNTNATHFATPNVLDVSEKTEVDATHFATQMQHTLQHGLENRKSAFYESLVPFVEQYGRKIVREFYDYWSEPNKSLTKMRFELQPTWNTNLRLARWANNDTDRYGLHPNDHINSAMNLQKNPDMYNNDEW